MHIPKGDGKTRPIGIPTYEDKILQRAVAMVLGAVYEQEFCECSYGFRLGRSAHQALEVLWKKLMDMGGGTVVDVDVQAFFEFFDSMDHVVLREFLDRRVRDGVLRRAIDKWLSAGVLEEGIVIHPETGTPQGGVISPLLANVYLHEVLDRWFEETVKPRLEGEAFLVRYADDFVMVFASPQDAQRVMKVLAARFAKFIRARRGWSTLVARVRATWGRRKGASLSWGSRTTGGAPARSLGGEAQDGVEADKSRRQGSCRMVSEEPAQAVGGATPEARTQDPRALRVLRDHRELAAARTISRPGGEGLAQVAEPERAAQKGPRGSG